jgi:hypothetical protein
VVRRVVGSGWGGAIKLGPGVDLDEIGREFPDGRIEVISENGRLVQCMVWMDMPFAGKEPRRATLVRGVPEEPEAERAARTVSVAGTGDEVAPETPGSVPSRWVYEPDDSVERAGLLGVLCETVGAPMLHARVGLLTSDALIESPWLTAFEVLAEMPWNERRVKGALEERGASVVEVKTRGKAVDTDQVQAMMRGGGDVPLVLFVLRFDRQFRAIVARRCSGSGKVR